MARKMKTVSDNNAEYLRAVVNNALNSDPEIKFAIRPAEAGIRSSDATLMVKMNTGETYRVDVFIKKHVTGE